MPLNINNVLKMVEEEITSMKNRQQFVVGTYQQQTREDLFKKFLEAENNLLAITKSKLKDLDIEEGNIYIIKGNSKEVTFSLRRINDERSLLIEIDPIIYPTEFNLKFIFDEPSISLYTNSLTDGIISLNRSTYVRTTDIIKVITLDELKEYISLWIKPSKENISDKIKKLISKLGSEEFLIESLLVLSKKPPNKKIVYLCNDHALKGYHLHDSIIDINSIIDVILYHLRLG
jgi:hypothetical protein